ncbi:hypothetical protein Thermus77412_10870 [Thermus antranikianii]
MFKHNLKSSNFAAQPFQDKIKIDSSLQRLVQMRCANKEAPNNSFGYKAT